MFRSIAAGLCLVPAVLAQTNAKVDFARDIQPIFRQNCVGCHGQSQANAGLRLDQKSSALKYGARRITPGSIENSFLYHRLTGNDFGMQMPPTGALKPEQIATIRKWIEEGADWPDALSNEAAPAPPDPKAIATVESLRTGDREALLHADAKLLNARGPQGATPFMFAALYGDAPLLAQLLKRGANPNAKDDSGSTALMWAVTRNNLAEARVLLDHGAEVNALSDYQRSPLMIAAGLPGSRPLVKLLLAHGANPNPTKHPDGESSPLIQAALGADPEGMQLLIDHGADVKASAAGALMLAYVQECPKCAELLIKHDLSKDVYTGTLQLVAPFADAATVRTLLDHGAAADAPDPLGHTPLAYAAGSDQAHVEVVKLLLDHGAAVNSKSPHPSSGDTGMTVLDIARLRGDTPVTALLAKAGGVSAVSLSAAPKPQAPASVQEAVRRSLPLLQRADAGFTAKAGCISCHNDSMAAAAVGLARTKGFPVDETLSEQQVKVNVDFLAHQKDTLLQGFFAPGGASSDTFGPGVAAYQLVGLDAEHYKADLNTDAVALYLKSRQVADGHWPYFAVDQRPPICSMYVGQTALSMRALQLYAPQFDKAIQLAAAWLAHAPARTTEDAIWKVQGLAWAARDAAALKKAQNDLLALQRANGGWADLPTMEPGAYSTGRALVALQNAGLPVSDPAYQRGMKHLLATQLEDGSWFVRTRALGFQPYFETGFPHGVNQSISAAGTSWATMALTLGAEPARGTK